MAVRNCYTEKFCWEALEDGNGCEGWAVKSCKICWGETGSTAGEKVRQADVENHLGMDERVGEMAAWPEKPWKLKLQPQSWERWWQDSCGWHILDISSRNFPYLSLESLLSLISEMWPWVDTNDNKWCAVTSSVSRQPKKYLSVSAFWSNK